MRGPFQLYFSSPMGKKPAVYDEPELLAALKLPPGTSEREFYLENVLRSEYLRLSHDLRAVNLRETDVLGLGLVLGSGVYCELCSSFPSDLEPAEVLWKA